MSAIAWSVVYSFTPLQTVQLALLMILRDYLLVGVVVATVLWYVCNVCTWFSALISMKVFLKSHAVITTIPLNARRFRCRMGICV